MKFKDMLKTSWMPILLIIFGLIGLALFLPEVTADPISLQDTTQSDWFELQKLPTKWECDAPLVMDYDGEYFCNNTMSPSDWTEHKTCLGKDWDFSKGGMPKELVSEKVGGQNYYKYCVNEIILKNPTESMLSITDLTLKVTDMDTGLRDMEILTENPLKPGELVPWTLDITKSWDSGLEIKAYVYGEKNDKTDDIEWDFELTHKPTGYKYYKDPFWSGTVGEISSARIVVNEEYWFDDFEDYAPSISKGQNMDWQTIYHNATAVPSSLDVWNVSGNMVGNITSASSNVGLYYNTTALNGNLTMRAKFYCPVDSQEVYLTGLHFPTDAGYTSFWQGGVRIRASGGRVRFREVYDNTAYNINTTNTNGTIAGNWHWLKIDKVEDNVNISWSTNGLDYQQTVNDTLANASFFASGRGVGFTSGASVCRVDNFQAQSIIESSMNNPNNISFTFLPTDAENDRIKNFTVFWYRDGELVKTQTTPVYNRTNHDWTMLNSDDEFCDANFFANATACDEGASCANIQSENNLTLTGAGSCNTAPTMDNVNISSIRGWNTSGENLLGGFNWSDPDADTWTNETLWWKDGSIIAALDDLQEISSSNTSAGETWAFSARVNDGTVWSDWKNSSNLTINTIPTQGTPILNSTDGSNQSSQNLTVYNITTADVDDHLVKNIVLWFKENNHYAHVYFPFEGGSLNGNSTGVPNGTRDYSDHGNNATVYNATWLPTGGYDGFGAYEFDGTNTFIDLNASAVNFNQTSGTIMAWFKLNDASSWSDGATRNLLQFRGGSGNAVTLYKSSTNEMRWRYVAGNIANETALDVSSRTDTDWHHMAMTWDVNAKEMKAYWDGVQTGSTLSVEINWTQDAETGDIGARYLHDFNFNGTIDEVQSYHRALSSAQILAFATNITDMIVSQETSQNQIWKSQMTPNDGREDGVTTESNILTILNAIPTIPSLNITSSDPLNYTNGTLTAYHNYNDVDGDAWIANSTKWFKDTVEQIGLQNTTIVSSALTSASEVWVYSAAVQDAIGDWSLWYNATITIVNAPPYQILTVPDVAFDEDNYNDTINGNTYFYDLEGTTLGFEFYGNNTNLNTTITNATGAFLFTAKNDWFGSVTGYITAVDGSVAKGNASNFTITVNNVNDIPTVPWINITSTDMLNRTNGTLYGNHGYADLENNTWVGNWTRWFKDGADQIAYENSSIVSNASVASGETWIYSARVNDGFNWSDWLNSTSLLVTDSNASVSIILFNHSEGYFDFEDIGFTFTPFDPDGGSIDVSLNITNNNVNIYTQLASILSGTTYSGNLTQSNFNQTQVINISILPDDVVTELKNATKTIKSITVTATDAWYYGINETESGGYNLTITESYGYPYDINLSAILYRAGITYTPTILQYRTNNLTIFNVTIPMPLTPFNHTNISSRWEWNQSVYGVQSTTTTTSRNQTVDHGYFFTDFFSLPTYILEAERFLSRINYSSLQAASISNTLFEVLNGSNFTGTLNGTSQFYHNQVYSPLLPSGLNSTIHTLQARANFSYGSDNLLRAKNTTFTVTKMIVTECGAYTNTTIHVFRLWNETLPTENVTGDVKVAYNAFLIRGEESRNYSFIKTDNWNHSVCLWPAWANFKVDTIIQYEGAGFTPRTYYHYGLLLPNSTPTYTDLYLLDTTLATAITMYVKDQDDNPISDAFIKLLKFYPEESLYRTVQIAQTDASGIGLVKLQIIDAFYKVILEKAGVLIDQTDKSVYLNQPYYFRVNLLADFLDSWNKMDRLNSYLIFPNATGVATFFWNDAQDIVRTGCLEVFTRTAYRDSQLSYECLNSSIGTLSYAINLSVEGHYFATTSIESNTNDTLYSGETKELIIENVTLAIFGLFGVFLALIVYMILCLIGATINPSVALSLGVLGIVSFVILQFLHLTWVSIMLLILFTVILMYLIRT